MKNKENLFNTFLIFLKLLVNKLKSFFISICDNLRNYSNRHYIKKPNYCHSRESGNPDFKIFTFLSFDFYKKDIAKFIIYTLFFNYLLFTYQVSNGPQEITTLNSANNIETYTNKEIEISDYKIGEKKIKKPLLSLEINPNNANIDNYLIKGINLNIKSNFFKEKVTPISIKIDNSKVEPRGQVIGNKLTLSGKIGSIDESIKVLVHELGHIIDLHFLPNLGDYDPSNNFYNISWASYNVKKKGSILNDFVSGYALTNKYEDFAESFSLYVFHNEEFQKRAINNEKLLQKYNFFKKNIFIDSEFFGTSFEKSKILAYNWDTTKIQVNLKKYLYYIK